MTSLKGKNLLPVGANSFFLRVVPILNRSAVEENSCLFQWYPIDARSCLVSPKKQIKPSH